MASAKFSVASEDSLKLLLWKFERNTPEQWQ